ncbi:MAG TPA: hypothetical protein VET24_13170 [Actinomycetota bacterium]|nr:hypothetical protein [Actinomycetota bacterium]
MIAAPLAVVVVVSMVGLAGLYVGGILWGARDVPLTPEAEAVRSLAALTVGGWAVLAVLLAARGTFATHADRFNPGVLVGLVAPILLGVLLFSTVGPLRTLARAIPVPWLIGIQVYRVFGVTFVIAALQGRMPYEFALAAGLGDMAIGVLAPLVAIGLARGRRGARALAVAWNVAGIADLVVAVTLGVLTSPSTFQALALGHPNAAITRFPFVLVPVFAVPASVLLHVLALWRLRDPAPAASVSRSRSGGTGSHTTVHPSAPRARPGRF